MKTILAGLLLSSWCGYVLSQTAQQPRALIIS
jgi:hypothetical protein